MRKKIQAAIEKLRAKPDRERKFISIGISAAITLVIFAVWFTGYYSQLGSGQLSGGNSLYEDITSPFAAIKDRAAGMYSNVSSGVIELNDQSVAK